MISRRGSSGRRGSRGGLLLLVVAFVISACSGTATETVRAEPSVEQLRFPGTGIELAATLCLPGGQPPFPAAVVVHGSGMTWGKDLRGYCDALNPRGLAVLLYDKRGVGNSGGAYRSVSVATSAAQLGELSDDAVAALDYLRTRRDIDPQRVGLIGQSQAGWIIPLAASKRPDVAFLVLISGPSVSVGEEMYYSNLTRDTEADSKSLRDEEYEQKRKREFTGPYGYDPQPGLENLRVPSLWLLGEKDQSIPALRCARVLSEARRKNSLPIAIKLYDNGDHGLRDVRSGEQIPYWSDIYKWLSDRRMANPAAAR